MTDTTERGPADFRDSYNRYGQMLYHICLNALKSPSDAEDAVQEVFLRYYDRTPQLASEEHRKAWLIRTAINYCKDQYKGFWRRRVRLAETEMAVAPVFPDPGSSDLFQAMLKLPQKLSVCLYLFYVQEMTVATIARALGIGPSAVKMRLKRGREALRQAMEGNT
ncbi:MAG: RNA polymerase subunit sigma [Clostridiaceae bacterium]|nr:RNA polymerase subunit sigma [Clostridiaceae bacterium]